MSRRKEVRDCIDSFPGVHFRGIVVLSDLAIGQVQYHLRILCEEERVQKRRLFGYVRYFPASTAQCDMPILAALRVSACRRILAHIASHEGMHCARIEEHVSISKSTLSWHLARLEKEQVIKSVPHGAKRCIHFVRPLRTRALLESMK